MIFQPEFDDRRKQSLGVGLGVSKHSHCLVVITYYRSRLIKLEGNKRCTVYNIICLMSFGATEMPAKR